MRRWKKTAESEIDKSHLKFLDSPEHGCVCSYKVWSLYDLAIPLPPFNLICRMSIRLHQVGIGS